MTNQRRVEAIFLLANLKPTTTKFFKIKMNGFGMSKAMVKEVSDRDGTTYTILIWQRKRIAVLVVNAG